jgi:TolB protein
LLVVSSRDGKADIFVVNSDGTGAKRLTDGKSINAYPAWSRDRREIAFASNRDGVMNV